MSEGRPLRLTMLLDGRLLLQRGGQIIEVMAEELPPLIEAVQTGNCGEVNVSEASAWDTSHSPATPARPVPLVDPELIGDIDRIVALCQSAGYRIERWDAQVAWKRYSDEQSATWLSLPASHREVYRIVLQHTQAVPLPADEVTTPQPAGNAWLLPSPLVAYECETCGAVFEGKAPAVRASLLLHRRREHPAGEALAATVAKSSAGPVKNTCPTCGHVFEGTPEAVTAAIESHRQREHQTEPARTVRPRVPILYVPEVCRVCGVEREDLPEVDLGNGLMLRLCPDCREMGPRGCTQALLSETISRLEVANGLANLTDEWERASE